MPNTARSGAIPNRAVADAAEASDIDDETAESTDAADAADAGEEKLRSGIQSIEVGFRLLDVLTREPRAMMLRDLAQRAGMSPRRRTAIW